MRFGEYELFLSLIGLSPLPAVHPKTFQRLLVRPSIPCYRNFSLVKDRSQSFASTPSNSIALFRLAFATATPPTSVGKLTLLQLATRRIINQKARGHPLRIRRFAIGLPPLVSLRFQVLFHSPYRGAFQLSLTVLVHYRSQGSI